MQENNQVQQNPQEYITNRVINKLQGELSMVKTMLYEAQAKEEMYLSLGQEQEKKIKELEEKLAKRKKSGGNRPKKKN